MTMHVTTEFKRKARLDQTLSRKYHHYQRQDAFYTQVLILQTLQLEKLWNHFTATESVENVAALI